MNNFLKHHYTLGFGLIIGILLATFTIVEKNNISDQNWAAKIEDRLIPLERYEMQLVGLANDKRSPLTEEDKAYVLERMIEVSCLDSSQFFTVFVRGFNHVIRHTGFGPNRGIDVPKRIN